MKSEAKTVNEYIDSLSPERAEIISELREIILQNLPDGFKEEMNYGMIGYVVPHSVYPEGYHCTPDKPLPFLNIASQKNFIGLYHMGIYAIPEINEWFVKEYNSHCKRKLDMGKSCVRFKYFDDIPYKLIGELVTKISVNDWISFYQKSVKK